MTLHDALAANRFAVTAELGPPLEPDAELVRGAARALAGVVDAANITDNQAATVKMAPLVCAILMEAEGLEPILQMTGRDRNLLALQAELLAAWAMGVRTVLALSGDPLKVGPYEALATHVGDVDSLGLTRAIVAMNDGRLAAGETLATPTGFLIAGAANPLVDSVERIERQARRRRRAAADEHRLRRPSVCGVARAAARGRRAGARADAGRRHSARAAGGCSSTCTRRSPESRSTTRRSRGWTGLEGEAARAEGVAIAASVIAALRDVDGIAGVHVMAPGWEVEAVPAVVEAAGLAVG